MTWVFSETAAAAEDRSKVGGSRICQDVQGERQPCTAGWAQAAICAAATWRSACSQSSPSLTTTAVPSMWQTMSRMRLLRRLKDAQVAPGPRTSSSPPLQHPETAVLWQRAAGGRRHGRTGDPGVWGHETLPQHPAGKPVWHRSTGESQQCPGALSPCGDLVGLAGACVHAWMQPVQTPAGRQECVGPGDCLLPPQVRFSHLLLVLLPGGSALALSCIETDAGTRSTQHPGNHSAVHTEPQAKTSPKSAHMQGSTPASTEAGRC